MTGRHGVTPIHSPAGVNSGIWPLVPARTEATQTAASVATHRPRPGSPAPITPAQAVAIAAIIRAHPHPMPHWLRWADELQQWGETHMEAEP